MDSSSINLLATRNFVPALTKGTANNGLFAALFEGRRAPEAPAAPRPPLRPSRPERPAPTADRLQPDRPQRDRPGAAQTQGTRSAERQRAADNRDRNRVQDSTADAKTTPPRNADRNTQPAKAPEQDAPITDTADTNTPSAGELAAQASAAALGAGNIPIPVPAVTGTALAAAKAGSKVAATILPLIAGGAPRASGQAGKAGVTAGTIPIAAGAGAPPAAAPGAGSADQAGPSAQVSVTKTPPPLVSQPNAALVPNAALAAAENAATGQARLKAAGVKDSAQSGTKPKTATAAKTAGGPALPTATPANAPTTGATASPAAAPAAAVAAAPPAQTDLPIQPRGPAQPATGDIQNVTALGTDGTRQAGPAANTAAPQTTRTAPPPPPPPAEQVAVQIQKAFSDGLDKITIQLKPAALGRVGVQLEVGHDGRVTAVFAADRQDTLNMLQRDARGLERALQDAGLRTDSGSLNFNFSGGGHEDRTQPLMSTYQFGANHRGEAAGGNTLETVTAVHHAQPLSAPGRIDIRV